MLLRRRTPKTGVCFAWTPKGTPDGIVWLEMVRYRFNESEFGNWTYTRLPRVTNWNPTFYTTPAVPAKCKNFNPSGPTPCWHPHCDCQKGVRDPAFKYKSDVAPDLSRGIRGLSSIHPKPDLSK